MKYIHYPTLLIIILTIALSVACSKDADTTEKNSKKSPIDWVGMTEGLERAAKERKLIFVDLYADWCGPCKYMDATTYKDSTVVHILNTEFIPIKLDADSKELIPCERDQKALAMECAAQIWQVQGLPGTIILDKEGYFLTSTMGIQDAQVMGEALTALYKDKETLFKVVGFEKAKAQKAAKSKK